MFEAPEFEDLFDIEKRPGAGSMLWTNAVKLQLERVQDANRRHVMANWPDEEHKKEDPDALRQLHADVYFLTLAIRRVLLFHDLLAKHVKDERLTEARSDFGAYAEDAKTFRDFYEHLDEYLLDSPRKHVKIPGRASPVLISRWDRGNVVISFGGHEFDVTLAGTAALKLGEVGAEVWEEHRKQLHAARPDSESPPANDGVRRTLVVRSGVEAVIGVHDDPVQQQVGTLLGVEVREATPEEIARYDAGAEA